MTASGAEVARTGVAVGGKGVSFCVLFARVTSWVR